MEQAIFVSHDFGVILFVEVTTVNYYDLSEGYYKQTGLLLCRCHSNGSSQPHGINHQVPSFLKTASKSKCLVSLNLRFSVVIIGYSSENGFMPFAFKY